MRINIDIELTPDELPMAKEVITLLNQLTGQYRNSSTRVEIKRDYGQILRQIEEGKSVDQVATEINNLIPNMESFQPQTLCQEFENILFDAEALHNGRSLLPYFAVMARLSEPVRFALRDGLVPHILQVVAAKRPLDVDRMDILCQAECFAVLVKMELVDVTRAVVTMTALVQKQETRCAAVTMLGKTVEMCLSLLSEKCDPTAIQTLKTAIDHHIFEYDLTYIRENLGWDKPIERGLAGTQLMMTSSTQEHNGIIYAMACDKLRDTMVSSSNDGTIISWSKDRKVKDKIQMAKHYACAIDVSASQKAMYVCGIPRDAKNSAAVVCYNLNEKSGWVQKGIMERDTVKLVSCVKLSGRASGCSPAGPRFNPGWALALNTNDSKRLFVTGESMKNTGEREKVRVYDTSSGSFNKLTPLISYEEHDDIITCLTEHPILPGLFLSASKDCSIKLWDSRLSSSASSFGVPNSTGKIIAHDKMVTCIDTHEFSMVSVSLDSTVAVWDIRKLDRPAVKRSTVDNTGILKVAIGPTNTKVVVASLGGLYVLDLLTGVKTAALRGNEMAAVRYHDLRWSADKSVLWAGGEDKSVDVYTLS
ncbi:hypothetical protein PROFUN_01513 [Planoprotostelium fungivorum]|uniref:Uncharacterized protein n=1 Tax=Planoprotostelium fungivorum TaxID=1890364 RepID=A0A2P6NTH8_9EUKA|nr:hypothetical protein PROFUN_01513 [Planoprotostelium fungivorum]